MDFAYSLTDLLIYYHSSFPTSLQIVIPELTKHCKLCELCSTGFDHHCMWLYRCVAHSNHRLFVLFCLCLGLDHFLFVKEALSCEMCMSIQCYLVYFQYDSPCRYLNCCRQHQSHHYGTCKHYMTSHDCVSVIMMALSKVF